MVDPVGVGADGESRGTLILGATWALVPAALILMLLRIYCKIKDNRKLWFDDYALIFAWVRRRPPCASRRPRER